MADLKVIGPTRNKHLSDAEVDVALGASTYPEQVFLSTSSLIPLSVRENAAFSATYFVYPESRPEWLTQLVPQLRDFLERGEDWDGYKASEVSSLAVGRTYHFLSQLPSETPRPRIVPNAEGAIEVEWVRGALDLTLEFSEDSILLFYDDGTTSWEGPLGEEPDGLSKLLWNVVN